MSDSIAEMTFELLQRSQTDMSEMRREYRDRIASREAHEAGLRADQGTSLGENRVVRRPGNPVRPRLASRVSFGGLSAALSIVERSRPQPSRQFGQHRTHRRPKDVQVDIVISMDQPIAHADDRCPGNIRLAPRGIRERLGSLLHRRSQSPGRVRSAASHPGPGPRVLGPRQNAMPPRSHRACA